MTRWTDTLCEPLATAARLGDWRLINEARGGGWLLLPDRPVKGNGWRHLAEDSLDLSRLSPFDDKRLKGFAPTVARYLSRGDAVELLAWRVGKRAVLKVTGSRGARIVKVYRKDRDYLRRWSAMPSTPDDRWRSARVHDWHPRRVSLTVEYCRGESPNRRWLQKRGEVADADRIADLLAWIHARPVDASLERFGPEDETDTLRHRLETFERTLRMPPARARRLVQTVGERLHARESRPVLCHRDLHDKQILLDGDRGYLIDLDLVALGSPALDVGNILAHIHLRWLKGVPLPWEELVGRIATAAHADREMAGSLPAWTASTLLRLALIYSRRRHEPGMLDALMDASEAALAASGPWRALRG